jgi:hypothetical protein
MRTFHHQKRCSATVARPKVSNLINTWLQPGASSNETHQPFQRLASESKTVETVFPFSFADATGLKPGVNETTACIFHAL